MKTLMLTATLALAACLAAPAWAAAPKAESTVTGGAVTVGDVFDDAGEFAGRYLAPAPAPGGVLTLNARDLARIASAFGLDWQAGDGGPQAVAVRRAVTEIDAAAIQAALREEVTSALRGDDYELNVTGAIHPLRLPPGAEKTVRIDDLKIDLQRNRFTATAAAPAEKPVVRKPLSGTVRRLLQVPVLKEPLRAGDVIGARDIEYIDMRSDDVSANTIVDAEKLMGLTPRRGVGAMKPLSAADFEQPLVVKKGDLVTVVLKTGTISLTMQGRALQNGAAGDIVRVVNTASSRALDATVTGPQAVAVMPPSSAL